MDMSSSLESFEGPDRLVYSGGRDTGLDAGTNRRCFGSFGFERFRCPRKWLYISCRDSDEKEQSSLTQSKASVSRFRKRVRLRKIMLGQCLSFRCASIFADGRLKDT